jgi:RNA polymerase sigma-70 factor, ECF subfamily
MATPLKTVLKTSQSALKPLSFGQMTSFVPEQNNTPLADDLLMNRVGNGDSQAYAQLVNRYLPKMRALALRLTQNDTIADDICQDVFFKLWQHAANWQPDAALGTWLYRVTYNQTMDYFRRHKHTSTTIDIDDELADKLADTAPNPEQNYSNGQISAQVQAALQLLPQAQRSALLLFHYHGLSQQHVAEAMALNVGAVEGLLFRGRQKMKQVLSHLTPITFPIIKNKRKH